MVKLIVVMRDDGRIWDVPVHQELVIAARACKLARAALAASYELEPMFNVDEPVDYKAWADWHAGHEVVLAMWNLTVEKFIAQTGFDLGSSPQWLEGNVDAVLEAIR